MKLNLDILLILGMALCYGLGQLFAADRFAMLAGLLLLVFLIRLIGSSITWIVRGR